MGQRLPATVAPSGQVARQAQPPVREARFHETRMCHGKGRRLVRNLGLRRQWDAHEWSMLSSHRFDAVRGPLAVETDRRRSSSSRNCPKYASTHQRITWRRHPCWTDSGASAAMSTRSVNARMTCPGDAPASRSIPTNVHTPRRSVRSSMGVVASAAEMTERTSSASASCTALSGASIGAFGRTMVPPNYEGGLTGRLGGPPTMVTRKPKRMANAIHQLYPTS